MYAPIILYFEILRIFHDLDVKSFKMSRIFYGLEAKSFEISRTSRGFDTKDFKILRLSRSLDTDINYIVRAMRLPWSSALNYYLLLDYLILKLSISIALLTIVR